MKLTQNTSPPTKSPIPKWIAANRAQQRRTDGSRNAAVSSAAGDHLPRFSVNATIHAHCGVGPKPAPHAAGLLFDQRPQLRMPRTLRLPIARQFFEFPIYAGVLKVEQRIKAVRAKEQEDDE
jgi:hypothetical protein